MSASRSSLTAPTSTRPRKPSGFDIDYKRLLALFRTKGQLVRALYYTALAEDQEYSSIRPLVDWLDYNGYTMVTKPTKEFTDALGRRKIKGNMDIELTVDAMRLVEHLDHVVLFTGDGDFRALGALPCSSAGDGSASCRRCRPSRRWSPTSCAGRPTSSSTWQTSKSRSAAIRPPALCASRDPAPSASPSGRGAGDDARLPGRGRRAGHLRRATLIC